MGKLRFDRRSLTIAGAGAALAVVGLIVAAGIFPGLDSAVAGSGASSKDLTSAYLEAQEHRDSVSASSRGDRAAQLSAQQPAEPTSNPSQPTPAPPGDSKGPGLASPLPSQLEVAAAAVSARIEAGQAIKVGVQAGHWKNSELPDELALLRGSTGAMGIGWREVDVNLDVARKVAAALTSFGIQADLLPATVPVGYKADAFVAIHADANNNKSLTGFKIARASWSTIPRTDDALVAALTGAYQDETGLPWHAKTITDNMTEYYAFNHKLQHSVSSGTPSAIVEMGFLTNPLDQKLMLTDSNRLAQSVALGILNFLAK